MSRGLADASKTHRASKSLDFFTANGITSATEVCDDKLPVLGERVQAYVLDDTPSVLSLGARCMKKGVWLLLASLRLALPCLQRWNFHTVRTGQLRPQAAVHAGRMRS